MAVATTRWRPSTAERGYGPQHRAARERCKPFVLAGVVPCARCGELIKPTEAWDLGHVDGDRSRWSGPEHARCNRATKGRQRPGFEPERPPELVPERDGLDAGDRRWRVPWLRGLRTVPANATWPRLMTVPHPAAVGSLRRDFVRWSTQREGRELRWWQQLVAARLLEVDDQDRLVWDALLLSMARQCGKSWLLRELILWRMHQRDHFGEPQDVLHTGKDLQVCKEVLRPALNWAAERPGYKVSRANGEQSIEYEKDKSRWLLRARGAVVGHTVSVAAVDEAWKVGREVVADLTPVLVERVQPQLWLISTAHRAATPLMLDRRKVALENLEAPEGDLLIEWSAPRDAQLDDVSGWRQASPYWTGQRQKMISRELRDVLAGEGEIDADELDPVESFTANWMNRWPIRKSIQLQDGAEPLLEPGRWAYLTESVSSSGPVWVAIEDDHGDGAAVAMAGLTVDGRIEVDGCTHKDWDTAIVQAFRVGERRQIRQLLVGASMLSRVPPGTVPSPQAAGQTETRLGLPLFRDLAAGGYLVHDKTTDELDTAVVYAQVKETLTGLRLVDHQKTHLVKALVWAVLAAHRPAPMPAVY